MQRVCSPTSLKKPLWELPLDFYIELSFSSQPSCPCIASSLPTSLPSFHISPPGMLWACKTSPCLLLLEILFLLLSVPTSTLLISTPFLLSKSQVTSLHSTPSLRYSYMTKFSYSASPMGKWELTSPVRGWPTGKHPSKVYHNRKTNASRCSPGKNCIHCCCLPKSKHVLPGQSPLWLLHLTEQCVLLRWSMDSLIDV